MRGKPSGWASATSAKRRKPVQCIFADLVQVAAGSTLTGTDRQGAGGRSLAGEHRHQNHGQDGKREATPQDIAHAMSGHALAGLHRVDLDWMRCHGNSSLTRAPLC